MKDGFLQAPGIAYRANSFDPSRKTIVFVHGLSGSCSAWTDYEHALEDRYNIVTYDLRGHGLSKKYLRYAEYDLKNFADDLHTLLVHLNISSCAFVAHSMGTTVALSFLHYYPGTATTVLFLAPNYKQRSMAGTATRVVLNQLVKVFSLFPFSPKQGHRVDYSNFGYSPDISIRRMFPEIKDMTLRVYLFCLTQLYQFTHDEWWAEIPIPTNIVHGTQDSFVPYRLGVELSHAIPKAKLVTLKGANHMLVLNNKKEIIEIIESVVGLK